MRPLSVLVPLIALVSIEVSRAQAQSVSGTVTGSVSGRPISLVNVRVKGTNQRTVSNSAGRYTLTVPSLQDTLLFSLIGYEPRQVPIDGRTEIDVQLVMLPIDVEAQIVTGYRVQDRGTITGSVASVNPADFADVPADNLSNTLAGRLSGVAIRQAAGTPGRESSIRVRAVGTFNNEEPLYVIDGMVSDKFAFDGLSSQEVQSVSILKDGAAASIYGSRAANGVILVTTRRGRIGPPQFSYSGNVGTQSPTVIPTSLNAYEHAKSINDHLSYNNVPTTDARYYAEDELAYFRENSWNWVEELWRDPVETQHALNVTGGTDGIKYFLGGSFLRGTGSFDNLSFQRVTSRANVDVDLSPRLKASVDFSTSQRDRHGPSWSVSNDWDGDGWRHEDLYKALLLRSSMVPPYVNGMPVGNWVEWHPGVVIANEAGYDRRDAAELNTRFRLDYRAPFVEGLSANLGYYKATRENHRKQFNLPYEMAVFNTLGTNNHIVGAQRVGTRPRNADEFLMERQDRATDYQFNAQVSYVGSFGEHNVDGLLVYEQAENEDVWFFGRRDDFISPSIDQFIGGSSDPLDSEANGRQSQGARISYVGSLIYSYARKYLLQGSFRYDGSVIFAPENRWSFFPSVSAGWRVTEEPFFGVDFIDDLLLRASYGVVGNDDVGSFQWVQTFDIVRGGIFGNPTVGLMPGALANRDITWEKTRSYNLGLDSRFWGNRMSLTLDVFYRNTYDILGDRESATPSTLGAELPDENYQEINSRGFEIELGYDGLFGNPASPVEYYLRGNLGYATNEVVRLDEAENIRPYESRIGRPIMPGGSTAGGCFALIAANILRTQADLDALPAGYRINGRQPQLGDLNYVDLRGPTTDDPTVDPDKPDGIISDDDRAWICDYVDPPVNYGLTLGGSWKGLRITALFHGAAGHQHRMHTNGRDIQARAEESAYGYWRDAWTPDNPDGAYPGWRNPGNYRTRYPESSFWVRDASFLRLKNLTVSLDLPQAIADRFGVNRARLYFTGTNLFLLQDNIGDWKFDPEAENIRAYPPMRTLSLGLNLTQ